MLTKKIKITGNRLIKKRMAINGLLLQKNYSLYITNEFQQQMFQNETVAFIKKLNF